MYGLLKKSKFALSYEIMSILFFLITNHKHLKIQRLLFLAPSKILLNQESHKLCQSKFICYI